jgi:hemin uptake protein HemP
MPNPPSPPADAAPTDDASPARTTEGQRSARAISSDKLFEGAQELHIDHRGTTYRLRRTSLGKLILTK